MSSSSSIKKNFVLNMIYTVSGIIFPLITFPYAARILFADGIGLVNFYGSVIEYIILLTSIGLPLYAIREIARVREDKTQMPKTVTEILLLHSLLSGLGYLIVFILISTVTKIQSDISLFLLLSLSIFFKSIGVEWFYNGIEDFKYITIRSVIVRVLSLIALFVFVKERDDLFYFAAISVMGSVGSNIFNFFRLRKYIDISCIRLKELNIRRHLKPALKVFMLNLVISLYINLDTVMLGFLNDDTDAVGYYSASTRITRTLIGVISSLGVVLLPRLSNLVINKKMDEFRAILRKTINFIIAISLPFMVGLIFMASPIIHLFCGDGFEPSILTLQIMAPIVLFISISAIYNMQVLYSLGKEKLAIISTSVGATLSLILNFILIPYYSQYGAAFSTLIAELVVVIMAIILGGKYHPINIFSREKMHYFIATLIVAVLLLFLKYSGMGEIAYLITGMVVSIIAYFTYLVAVKDDMTMSVLKSCAKFLRLH